MAGHGPPPAEQKRRRNKPPTPETLPAEGYHGEYPPLPASYGVDVNVAEVDPESGEKTVVTRRTQIRYLDETRGWYETWATSPMATKFTGVDWNRLKRVAILADSYYRRPTQQLAAELRLQEGLFGGTPVDRLRGQMRIGQTPDASPERERPAEVRKLRAV